MDKSGLPMRRTRRRADGAPSPKRAPVDPRAGGAMLYAPLPKRAPVDPIPPDHPSVSPHAEQFSFDRKLITYSMAEIIHQNLSEISGQTLSSEDFSGIVATAYDQAIEKYKAGEPVNIELAQQIRLLKGVVRHKRLKPGKQGTNPHERALRKLAKIAPMDATALTDAGNRMEYLAVMYDLSNVAEHFVQAVQDKQMGDTYA